MPTPAALGSQAVRADEYARAKATPSPHLNMRDWFLAVLDESARRHAEQARRNDGEERRP